MSKILYQCDDRRISNSRLLSWLGRSPGRSQSPLRHNSPGFSTPRCGKTFCSASPFPRQLADFALGSTGFNVSVRSNMPCHLVRSSIQAHYTECIRCCNLDQAGRSEQYIAVWDTSDMWQCERLQRTLSNWQQVIKPKQLGSCSNQQAFAKCRRYMRLYVKCVLVHLNPCLQQSWRYICTFLLLRHYLQSNDFSFVFSF